MRTRLLANPESGGPFEVGPLVLVGERLGCGAFDLVFAGFAGGVALLYELGRGEPVILTARGDEQCEHG